MKNDIMEWIIKWFTEHSNAEESDIRQHLNVNYLDMGYIDSFEFITFMGDIEDKFGVQFANDQFEDRSFSTIEGMAKIIEGLMK
ncbi:MAG: acyl carrier protein [Lachnospiraceae bacterium]|nr:acyl carrier protein [Lachnospiraceae bacterium]